MRGVEMQQPRQMFPVMSSFPPANITTEQIQKYLDENKNPRYLNSARLSSNKLLITCLHIQMSPHPAMQQGGFYLQHPQATAMAQQPGIFPPRAPLQFNNPHPIQDQRQHLTQQAMQAQMVLRPSGASNDAQTTHNDANLGGGSGIPTPNSGVNDVCGGTPQDKPEGQATGAGRDGDEAK
ncbi:GRF1-interacting factor 3-like [Olea europaea var. sylvestris]|uniref:GRF1-interacting factor 3-like n=1 Tax=Olea europaea var. sylvestris TaxID=158386 RepID=UPI000C1D0947|nr:GRF1-interacting factor 3-like [Olea europaea var. sylvestris]